MTSLAATARAMLVRLAAALCICLIAASPSHASAPWTMFPPFHSVAALSVTNTTATELESNTLWKAFAKKAKWGKGAARLGGMCALGVLSAGHTDSLHQQKTWWLKGLRFLTSCGIGLSAAAMTDLLEWGLLAMGAPYVVAFSTGMMVAGVMGIELERVAEQAWASSHHPPGPGRSLLSPGYAYLVPRAELPVHGDDYLHVTFSGKERTDVRHPQSRYVNGTHLTAGTNRTTGVKDAVGGYWRVTPPGHLSPVLQDLVVGKP